MKIDPRTSHARWWRGQEIVDTCAKAKGDRPRLLWFYDHVILSPEQNAAGYGNGSWTSGRP
ncbi:MAG: hypothetical protein U0531_05175 [Dehalococcoidia bacterium]